MEPRCGEVEVKVLGIGNSQVKYKYLKYLVTLNHCPTVIVADVTSWPQEYRDPHRSIFSVIKAKWKDKVSGLALE